MSAKISSVRLIELRTKMWPKFGHFTQFVCILFKDDRWSIFKVKRGGYDFL